MSSFFIFAKNNGFRRLCTYLNQDPVFNAIIVFCIFVSSVLLIFDSPTMFKENLFLKDSIRNADLVFTIVFILEMIVKMVSQNVWFSNEMLIDEEDAYFMSFSNQMDFLIVMVSITDWYITINPSSDTSSSPVSLSSFKALRSFRALRPFRLISRFDGLTMLVDSLVRAFPSMFHVLMIMSLFIFLFAIICINMFKGTF